MYSQVLLQFIRIQAPRYTAEVNEAHTVSQKLAVIEDLDAPVDIQDLFRTRGHTTSSRRFPSSGPSWYASRRSRLAIAFTAASASSHRVVFQP